jgi:hypothetical protein
MKPGVNESAGVLHWEDHSGLKIKRDTGEGLFRNRNKIAQRAKIARMS